MKRIGGKILAFSADPADIVEARKLIRITEENPDQITMLGSVEDVKYLYDRYYFQSSGEIVNFYRGEHS